ncbi:MAG: tetratricopeptide repeat protein [Bacteroidota bacterium]
MLENLSVQSIKDKLNTNKTAKYLTYGVGALIVLVVGYFGYRQLVWKPANEKSKDAYWSALNYVDKDSTELAIDELQGAVKKYDGKIGGEVAQFVLARQLMSKGEFKKALSELESVNVEDTYVSAMSIGLQGDCQSELKKYEEASDLYMEAAEINENDFTTPMYLFKAGLCAEKVKDFDAAVEAYTKIKDDYPTYASQKAIDKYIARAENKIVK